MQLADNECRAEWLYYLETGKVVEIKEMLGFQFGKKAGMTLQFDDGRKAMYKPCGSGKNDFQNFVLPKIIVVFIQFCF